MKHDYTSGSFFTYLPEGCRLCQTGAKMVLFTTGLCSGDCFYCPVSEERSRKDVIFANERPVLSDEHILEEASRMKALGTGITGGEPLLVPERVLGFITLLKESFGSTHHIHLYTAQSPQREILEKLAIAGLDEIRFHPPLDMWERLPESGFSRSIRWAKELDLDVGFEIPSLKEAKHIARFAQDCNIFLNLDELEFSHTNNREMKEHGFVLSGDEGYGVLGSRDVARNIIQGSSGLKAHYCSSCFKDAVQLRKRLLRTAETTHREFEEITPDGTLFYGIVEGKVDEIVRLLTQFDVPEDLYDPFNNRVELGWWVLRELSDEIEHQFRAWYEECYPTYGRMVVEKIPLHSAEIFSF
jgi:pyruvate formate-lyase activating enzyme-like uncharacterized protein